MKVKLLTLDGKNKGDVDLSDKIFSLKPNQKQIKNKLKINKNNQMDFVPLWGTVELSSGTMVTGYLVFDLPNDVTFSRLRWIASDTVTINY